MKYSEAEVTAFCEKYDRFVRKTVNEYLRKRPVPGYEEDFLQVARLAFHQYCRAKLEDERAIYLAKKSITDALFRLRLDLAPVSIPVNRYAREIGKYTMVSLDELNELPKGSYTFEEESMDRVMVQKYLATLSDTERASLMLWAEGWRNREIMAATGIPHSYQVTRMIQRLLKDGKAAIGYGGDDDGHA